MPTNWDEYLKDALDDPDLQERVERSGIAWDIALQIAGLRERRGLTQAELAERIGTRQSNVSRLENADYRGYSLQSLTKVARAVGAGVQVKLVPLDDGLDSKSAVSAEVDKLGDFFSKQDSGVQRNWKAASEEFRTIERGLAVGWATTLRLNEDPILALRKAKPVEVATPETICTNLLHAAWSSLVNATRLALYGAHVDALALTRSAFEATFHAEYFRVDPGDAIEWDKSGSITDLIERAQSAASFHGRILGGMKKKYGGNAGSFASFYAELSTYGSHANPITAALRLSSNVPGVANVGFASVGKSEATRLCASHILHVLGYTLSEFRDGFGQYLETHPDLIGRYDRFERELSAVRLLSQAQLSLLR